MESFKKVVKRLFPMFFRRVYVIIQITDEGKMFYKGLGDVWTSDLAEAYHYKFKPKFEWITGRYYKLELHYI